MSKCLYCGKPLSDDSEKFCDPECAEMHEVDSREAEATGN